MAKKPLYIADPAELAAILNKHEGFIRLGIDPGSKGGIAAVYPNEEPHAWRIPTLSTPKTEPDIQTCIAILAPFSHKDVRLRVRALLERTSSMPRDTPKTAFGMGRSRMLWEALLTALGIPWDFVTPAKWKHAFGLSSDKGASLLLAKRLFPSIEFPYKCDHDKAEALLLAEYLRRFHLATPKVKPRKRKRK